MLARALKIASGPIIMGVALGAATPVSKMLGMAGVRQPLLQAALCSGIALLLFLLTRDRKSESFAAAPYMPDVRGIVLATVLTLIAALASLAVFQSLGMIKVSIVSASTLGSFLASTAIVALLLEAFPEELLMRGRTFTTLRQRNNVVVAAAVTTALFLLIPVIANTTTSLIELANGRGWSTPALVPAGEDPIAYVILLIVFGLTLASVRAVSGSIWPGIGLHLVFLLFNRAALFGSAVKTGVATWFISQDALFQVPLYLLVAAIAFALAARNWSGRRKTLRS